MDATQPPLVAYYVGNKRPQRNDGWSKDSCSVHGDLDNESITGHHAAFHEGVPMTTHGEAVEEHVVPPLKGESPPINTERSLPYGLATFYVTYGFGRHLANPATCARWNNHVHTAPHGEYGPIAFDGQPVLDGGSADEKQKLYKQNVAKSVDTWRERGELPPAMGQPTNSEIIERLVSAEGAIRHGNVVAESIAREIQDWRRFSARRGAYLRIERDAAKARNDDTRELIRTIDTRLETLEAAFGIASSKSAEWFDRIWRRLDLLSGMVAATSWRPTKPRRKGKKKG